MPLMAAASNPSIFLALAISFIFAITVHEASHAFVANWLGDTTPRFRGRLTLNPIPHLDVFGTLALVVMGFGWGKPVPVNPANLRGEPRRGIAKVAFAGPAANLLIAILIGLLDRAGLIGGMQWEFGPILLGLLFQVNVLLAIFNLIPVPPLDGFTLLLAFVDRDTAFRLRANSRQIMMAFFGIFILAYFLRINLLSRVIGPPADFLAKIILGG